MEQVGEGARKIQSCYIHGNNIKLIRTMRAFPMRRLEAFSSLPLGPRFLFFLSGRKVVKKNSAEQAQRSRKLFQIQSSIKFPPTEVAEDVFMYNEVKSHKKMFSQLFSLSGMREKVNTWVSIDKLFRFMADEMTKSLRDVSFSSNPLNNSTLISFINPLVYDSTINNLTELEEFLASPEGSKFALAYPQLLDLRKQFARKDLVELMLSRYEEVNSLGRSFIIKYIRQFHSGDRATVNQLINNFYRNPVTKSYSVWNLIAYWREYSLFLHAINLNLKVLSDSEQEKYLEKICDSLPIIQPKLLKLFMQTVVLTSQQPSTQNSLPIILPQTFQSVREHLNKPITLSDLVYLIEVLEMVLNRLGKQYELSGAEKRSIYNLSEMIIGKFKANSAKDGLEGELEETEERGHDGNLYACVSFLGIMNRMKIIDDGVYELVEGKFFKRLSTCTRKQIENYIHTRNQICKTLINNIVNTQQRKVSETARGAQQEGDDEGEDAAAVQKSMRIRSIKQEHINFSLRLIGELGKRKMPLGEKLQILSMCQAIEVKSREIKRQLVDMMREGSATPSEVALCEVIIQNY